MKYCSNCGNPSDAKTCARCQVKQGKENLFCVYCGAGIVSRADTCQKCSAYTKKPAALKVMAVIRYIFGIFACFIFFVNFFNEKSEFPGQNITLLLVCEIVFLLAGIALIAVPVILDKKAGRITKKSMLTNIGVSVGLLAAIVALWCVMAGVQAELYEQKDELIAQQESQKTEEIINSVVSLFNEGKYAEIESIYEKNKKNITEHAKYAEVKDYFNYALVMNSMDADYREFFSFEAVIDALEGITPGFENRDELLSQLKSEMQQLNGAYYLNYIYYLFADEKVAYTSARSLDTIDSDILSYTYRLGKSNVSEIYVLYDTVRAAGDDVCYIEKEDIRLGFSKIGSDLLIAVHEYCLPNLKETLKKLNGLYVLQSREIPEELLPKND